MKTSKALRLLLLLFLLPLKGMSQEKAGSYEWKWGDPRLQMRGERLDYILLSPALTPNGIDATVHNGEDLEGISDHYPVSVRVALEASR